MNENETQDQDSDDTKIPDDPKIPDDSKIIVDDDWKSQVAAEKEALEKKRSQSPADAAETEAAETEATDATDAGSADADVPQPDDASPEAEPTPPEAKDAEAGKDSSGKPEFELPPASFSMHVTPVARQAMSALRYLPDESGQTKKPDLPLAKHLIDTLAMLQEKTKRNLTGDEHEMLKNILHDLRMAYVNASKDS